VFSLSVKVSERAQCPDDNFVLFFIIILFRVSCQEGENWRATLLFSFGEGLNQPSRSVRFLWRKRTERTPGLHPGLASFIAVAGAPLPWVCAFIALFLLLFPGSLSMRDLLFKYIYKKII
jgi:hypothetical protein